MEIDNSKSTRPAVPSGVSAGSFPEQRLVIEPTEEEAVAYKESSLRQEQQELEYQRWFTGELENNTCMHYLANHYLVFYKYVDSFFSSMLCF